MKIAAAATGRYGTAFEWLGIERAWSRTRGSNTVVIGIVDQGVQLDRLITDGVTNIAAGRSPVDDLDNIIKTWKAQGGDQIREEYQQKIAASK